MIRSGGGGGACHYGVCIIVLFNKNQYRVHANKLHLDLLYAIYNRNILVKLVMHFLYLMYQSIDPQNIDRVCSV